MIYVLLTYVFYPFLKFVTFFNKTQTFKKILVIQTAKIGDMVCSTPVFREIKKKYPEARTTVFASAVPGELLYHNPYVDEVVNVDTKNMRGFSGKLNLIKKIYKGYYDACISLNPNIPFTITPVWALIPVRIAIMPNYSGTTLKMASGLNTCLIRHESGRLVSETYIKMLGCIDITSDNISKEVYESPEAILRVQEVLSKLLISEGEPLVGIAVSSGNKLKELGAEKTALVADSLIDDIGLKIVLVGSEPDKKTAKEILNLSEHENSIIDSTGVFELNELPVLIKSFSLFIGVDTGTTYMADALSVPIINIAGPSDMADQRPTGRKCIMISKDISCVPCSHAFKAPYVCKRSDRACIETVNVSEVMDAAKHLLEMEK